MLNRLLICFVVLVNIGYISFTGCSNKSASNNLGDLCLNICISQDKIFSPDVDMEPVLFIITGNGPGDLEFTEVTDQTSIDITDLLFGEWNISVQAKNSEGIISAGI